MVKVVEFCTDGKRWRRAFQSAKNALQRLFAARLGKDAADDQLNVVLID
jgi:hypothetical protein